MKKKWSQEILQVSLRLWKRKSSFWTQGSWRSSGLNWTLEEGLCSRRQSLIKGHFRGMNAERPSGRDIGDWSLVILTLLCLQWKADKIMIRVWLWSHTPVGSILSSANYKTLGLWTIIKCLNLLNLRYLSSKLVNDTHYAGAWWGLATLSFLGHNFEEVVTILEHSGISRS